MDVLIKKKARPAAARKFFWPVFYEYYPAVDCWAGMETVAERRVGVVNIFTITTRRWL